ncbi:MAG: hypothetical protein CVT92_09490 [Bacteroidetes bacterium HGW-Bacteroidetes-1]|jgi:hypothetical protein|nr:MAG: hypothetical protein CVT92_09490 [Bacteroidetes bacterium HGW-Bacteroidetes-1]
MAMLLNKDLIHMESSIELMEHLKSCNACTHLQIEFEKDMKKWIEGPAISDDPLYYDKIIIASNLKAKHVFLPKKIAAMLVAASLFVGITIGTLFLSQAASVNEPTFLSSLSYDYELNLADDDVFPVDFFFE